MDHACLRDLKRLLYSFQKLVAPKNKKEIQEKFRSNQKKINKLTFALFFFFFFFFFAAVNAKAEDFTNPFFEADTLNGDMKLRTSVADIKSWSGYYTRHKHSTKTRRAQELIDNVSKQVCQKFHEKNRRKKTPHFFVFGFGFVLNRCFLCYFCLILHNVLLSLLKAVFF